MPSLSHPDERINMLVGRAGTKEIILASELETNSNVPGHMLVPLEHTGGLSSVLRTRQLSREMLAAVC